MTSACVYISVPVDDAMTHDPIRSAVCHYNPHYTVLRPSDGHECGALEQHDFGPSLGRGLLMHDVPCATVP